MIKQMVNKLQRDIKATAMRRQYHSVYRQVMDFTMIDPDLFYDNLKLVDMAEAIPGDVAECGVWKGGMSAGMAIRTKQDRHFYLFDSFEGLPQAGEADGPDAAAYQRGEIVTEKFFDNCTIDTSFATTIMQRSGKPFTLVQGWFHETMPQFQAIRPLALLRLDGDWYESTLTSLQNMYPALACGGILIIDDYHAWDGCTRAVHDYLSSIQSRSRINRTANGVAYLIKRDECALDCGTGQVG